MTAFATDIAAVKQLLPVRIDERRSENGNITIVDKNGKTFCRVPFDTAAAGENGTATDHSRAVMIVSALNALQDSFLPSRSHHDL